MSSLSNWSIENPHQKQEKNIKQREIRKKKKECLPSVGLLPNFTLIGLERSGLKVNPYTWTWALFRPGFEVNPYPWDSANLSPLQIYTIDSVMRSLLVSFT